MKNNNPFDVFFGRDRSVERSTLVGELSIESFSVIGFPKIGSLVFTGIVHDDSRP